MHRRHSWVWRTCSGWVHDTNLVVVDWWACCCSSSGKSESDRMRSTMTRRSNSRRCTEKAARSSHAHGATHTQPPPQTDRRTTTRASRRQSRSLRQPSWSLCTQSCLSLSLTLDDLGLPQQVDPHGGGQVLGCHLVHHRPGRHLQPPPDNTTTTSATPRPKIDQVTALGNTNGLAAPGSRR